MSKRSSYIARSAWLGRVCGRRSNGRIARRWRHSLRQWWPTEHSQKPYPNCKPSLIMIARRASIDDVRSGSWLRENAEIEFANGNFVSTSINLKNKSAGDGRWDKTIEKTFLRAFRARTFSRSQGHQRTWRPRNSTSALPPKADSSRTSGHV